MVSDSDAPRDEEESGYTICEAPWEQPEPDLPGAISDEEFLRCKDLLSKRPKLHLTQRELDLEPRRQVYQCLVLYRLRARKLLQGESKDKLADDEALPLFLRLDLPLHELDFRVGRYFRALEIEEGDHTIDWYFDSVYSRFAELDDYQRLVLRNRLTDVGYEYWTWAEYHSKLTTYEMDKDYIKFFDVLSSKLKWLKSYARYPEKSVEWADVYPRGLRQVLKIASEFPHLTSALAYTAYGEHIWTLRFDYLFWEGMDQLYFEIWKRVTKKKLSFAEALGEVLRENLVPRHQGYVQYTLENNRSSDLEERYHSGMEGISDDASEDVGKGFIIDAVWKRHNKAGKMLHQYMARKIEIAESIGLVNRPDVSTVVSNVAGKDSPGRKEKYVIPGRRLQF